jgi:hypothetical protein
MHTASDVWTELALHFLTPRSLGLLERTCKTLWRVVVDRQVWERQAVLAWNGFYSIAFTDFRAESAQFLAGRTNTRWRSVVFENGEWYDGARVIMDSWCDWGDILGMMEMPGSGYRVYAVVTNDPKEVTRHELEGGWILDECGGREWVEDLKDECWKELRQLEGVFNLCTKIFP